jgi:hypothetical protein
MLIFVFFVMVVVSSCTSYTGLVRDAYDHARKGEYEKAFEMIETSSVLNRSRNSILKKMEQGSLFVLQKELDQAAFSFNSALSEIEKSPQIQLAAEARSFIENDSARPYASIAEDYEQVLLASWILNLMNLDALDSSRVEAGARFLTQTLNRVYEKENSNDLDVQSALKFAYTLVGLSYLRLKFFNQSLIAFEQALSFEKAEQTSLNHHLCQLAFWTAKKEKREDAQSRLRRRCPHDAFKQEDIQEISLISYGWLGRKEPMDFFIPGPKNFHRISFPVIQKQSSLSQKIPFSSYVLLGDFNHWAHASLQRRRLKTFARLISRLAIKSRLSETASNQFGPLGYLAFVIYSLFTETADTRGWIFLPRAWYLGLNPVSTKGFVGQHRVESHSKVKELIWRHIWIH